MNQIRHLLDLFPKTEWSGPAFYSKVEENKKGWTDEWILEGFVPIDLGTTASTEFTGKEFIKKSNEIFKNHPEFKTCYQGLIHSHHSLGGGAFFSGTDISQLKDAANNVGYPSLVVARPETKSQFAFNVSWLDQFGHVHYIEEEDTSVECEFPEYEVEGYFKICVNLLKKQEKEKPKALSYLNGFSYNQNQLNLATGFSNTYYPENVKDDKYQKLLKKYKKAEKAWDNVNVGDRNFEKVEAKMATAEKALEDYIEKYDIHSQYTRYHYGY